MGTKLTVERPKRSNKVHRRQYVVLHLGSHLAAFIFVYRVENTMSLSYIFKLIQEAAKHAANGRPVQIFDCWDWKGSVTVGTVRVTVTPYHVKVAKHRQAAYFGLQDFENRTLEELTANFCLLLNSRMSPKDFFN